MQYKHEFQWILKYLFQPFFAVSCLLVIVSFQLLEKYSSLNFAMNINIHIVIFFLTVFNIGLMWRELIVGMEEIFFSFYSCLDLQEEKMICFAACRKYLHLRILPKSWLAGKISRLTGRNKRSVNISELFLGYSEFVVLCTGQEMEFKVYVNKEMFKIIWVYVWKRSKRPEGALALFRASDSTIGELKY